MANRPQGNAASSVTMSPFATALRPPVDRQGREVHTATPSTVRAVNRSIILNLIRLYTPISRAGLSKRSGISRSNVSHIVDQLIDQGMLGERPATPAGRGRVPKMLYLDPHGYRVIGASILPFRTSVTLAGLAGKMERTLSFLTPRKPDELIRKLKETTQKMLQEVGRSSRPFQGLGIAVPGLVHSNTGKVLWLPTLPEYSGFQLAAEMEALVGIPTAVENNVNLAALAELRFGEAADLSDFVVLAVTADGVGTGIVLNRELYRGHDTGFAGEFGHMVIDPSGAKCSCGRHGCWELYVSSRATWHRYSPRTKFEYSRFEDLIRLAQRGQPKALKAFRETARYLSIGISNIILALNPQMVIILGDITKIWNMIRSSVEEVSVLAEIKPPIRPGILPPDAMYLQGAVYLALGKAIAKPKLGW